MKSRTTPISKVLLASAIAMIAMGCARPAASGPASAEPPTEKADATPADCINMSVPAEGPGAPLWPQADSSDLIVVATFKGYGAARWNTPGAKRPSPSRPDELTSAAVLRPIEAQVESTAKGKDAEMTHAVSIGGSIGCDSVVYERTPQLEEGQRYVFFHWPISDSAGKLQGDLGLGGAYPVDGEKVSLPDGTSMTVADLTEQIRSGTLPTPVPGEVSQSTDDEPSGG